MLEDEVGLPSLKDRHVVLWGLRRKRDTFRFIHNAWWQTFRRHDMPVKWTDDVANEAPFVDSKAIVFAVNVASRHLPVVRGAKYVLHNINPDPFRAAALRANDVLTLQVWSNDVLRFQGANLTLPCVAYDEAQNTLYQPWGTPFHPKSWRREPILNKSRIEVWIGSVWNNDQNQGNADTIALWAQILRSKGIRFQRVPYGWPDSKFSYEGVARVSRVSASIVGNWQRESGYLPCRVFKNTSMGRVPVGNSWAYERVFGDSAVVSNNLEELLQLALELSESELQTRLASAQEQLRHYTYEQGLTRILERVM